MPLFLCIIFRGKKYPIVAIQIWFSSFYSEIESEECNLAEERGYYGYEMYYRWIWVENQTECRDLCYHDKFCTAASFSDILFGRRCNLYSKEKEYLRVKDELSVSWIKVCRGMYIENTYIVLPYIKNF